MTWNWHSKVKAKCGVDGCQERFHSRIEWVYHCKEAHPDYYKENLGDCGPCEITECSTRNSDECLTDVSKESEVK
jgi:hypothetical protein